MNLKELILELEKIEEKHGDIEAEVQYRDEGGRYYGTDTITVDSLTISDGKLIF